MDLTAYLTGLGMLLSGMLITMVCAHAALRHHRKRQATRLPAPTLLGKKA
jgi:hypothetical protein